MMGGLYHAHIACRQYALDLTHLNEVTYVEEFKSRRAATVENFMVSLRAANRGPLINNFNMYHMSTPYEFNLRNNFWFIYALSAQLDFQEKEERFKLLVQACSSEIVTRKGKFLGAGADFQPSLAMNCFWNGPCSVFKATEVSPSTTE